MNWVSAPGFSLSVAAVLGAAGLILGLLKDSELGILSVSTWLSRHPRDTRPEKLYLVPGLQNLGNNCFLNVILQALVGCSYFQQFLQEFIQECESSTSGEWSDSMQLTFSLATLLEELCACSEARMVLSPRKVMLAMADYVQNFNLTSQQVIDASLQLLAHVINQEAFLHLLSSLRDEVSDCYPISHGSLVDAFASPNCRILTQAPRETQNEREKWQQHFLGPFDGILSSILTCQSCSSEISLNFQFFHSLPLLPVIRSGATITGCTLEDCLKQFTVAEQVENYNCSNCWHIAAVKFLSLSGGRETEIEKIRSCYDPDSCTCHKLLYLESLPWSNKFCHTVKQLSIARCPKILCIHLQRASMNNFGELVKLQGHISFPLILDMRPTMLEKVQYHNPDPHTDNYNLQSDTRILNCNYGQNIFSELLAGEKFGSTENVGESQSSESQMKGFMTLPVDNEVSIACQLVPPQPLLYHLISVVEHFGRSGGGHYTVYRSARLGACQEDADGKFEPPLQQWFCISDSEVHRVSEEDVLSAEASLLFYERIVDG